jgi:uncharacterized membrane protein
MRSELFAFAAASLVLIAACEGESDTSAAIDPVAISAPVTAVFECEANGDAFAFTTRTTAEGLALWLPPRFERPYLALKQTPAASGSRHESEGVVVWLHGEETMLEVDGDRFSACRRNPKASIWEHAKLGGADFRATGNEPGWVLEIRERTIIDLNYDYGTSQILVSASEPVEDSQSMRTTWEASVDGQALKLEVSAVACTDTMSGDRFESTVVIYLGERKLSGCGRPLH